MSSRRTEAGTLATLLAGAFAAALGVAACSSDETPTGAPADAAAADVAASFGPFPGRTTVFVDVDNTSGVEDGSRAHPFNTLSEGLRAARSGDAVGLAPGVYAETFGPEIRPNYVIEGRRTFKLLGMGPGRTIIRGDHSGSLIRVLNGASGLISGMTIERGGKLPNSEGGGLQVLGIQDAVSLTVNNVILQDNWAVNGAAIAAEGRVTVRLVNVVVANNVASNCCGGVYLQGVQRPRTGDVQERHRYLEQRELPHRRRACREQCEADPAELDRVEQQPGGGGTIRRQRGDHSHLQRRGEIILPGTGNISAEPLCPRPCRAGLPPPPPLARGGRGHQRRRPHDRYPRARSAGRRQRRRCRRNGHGRL